MRTNSNMRSLLEQVTSNDAEPELPDDAQYILEMGWCVGPSGVLLLRALWDPAWNPTIDPSEIGDYEYHNNDVSVRLDDLDNALDSYLVMAALRGVRFAKSLLQDASGLPGAETLQAPVSVFIDRNDDLFPIQGVTVRFFTRRGHYPRWLEHLEGFEREAIAVLELSDAMA